MHPMAAGTGLTALAGPSAPLPPETHPVLRPHRPSRQSSTHRPTGHQPPRQGRAVLALWHLAFLPACVLPVGACSSHGRIGHTWIMYVSGDGAVSLSMLICLNLWSHRSRRSQAVLGLTQCVSLKPGLFQGPERSSPPTVRDPRTCDAVATHILGSEASDAGKDRVGCQNTGTAMDSATETL